MATAAPNKETPSGKPADPIRTTETDTDGNVGDLEGKLNTLIEQNAQIIALLKSIAE